MIWKKPNSETAEISLLENSSSGESEKEIVGGDITDEERRVGRESLGGRRWRSLERASAAAEVERWLVCEEGVGGGAAVAPPQMFGNLL